ncbi:MAG TPA: formylglycine-generating enzyme family protein [Pirellulales bacterium]|jgi:formylglycine-generating enzyme required for sulfatase activity|nr:formylglycine-generating enzyme family protein [Pirellulales bacterium]
MLKWHALLISNFLAAKPYLTMLASRNGLSRLAALGLALHLLASGALAQTAPAKPKPAAPNREQYNSALVLVKEVFKGEYAARAPADRLALAKKLAEQAAKAGDTGAERFVLWKEAAEIAATVGDASLALQAADRLGSEYEFDAAPLREELLQTLVRTAKTGVSNAAAYRAVVRGIDEAREHDELEVALKELAPLASFAAKSGDPSAVKAAQELAKQIRAEHEEFAKFKQAKESLAGHPDNAEASLAVGKYLCYTKGDWPRGLPFLVKGSDAALAEIAQHDLKKPTTAFDQFALANEWCDFAEKQGGASKNALQDRARQWYAIVLPQVSGLEKTLIEKRLAQLAPAGSGVAGKPIEIALNERVRMGFRRIPAGRFAMGSPANEPLRNAQLEQQHQVTITKPYYLGTTEVTQAQWQAVMSSNPSANKEDPNDPVEMVSVADAANFCARLTKAFAEKHYTFRLPTEAEWEYACRAGSTSSYSFGNDATKLSQYAWSAANSAHKTHPVGQLQPNAWGLYDMLGNVAEWCLDVRAPYGDQAAIDPLVQQGSEVRVHRGGSMSHDPAAYEFRSAGRGGNPASETRGYIGFRVLLQVN